MNGTMIKRATWILLAALWLAVPAQAQEAVVVKYIHTDALGTPIAVTDENGDVIERFEYEPYGLQVAGPVEDGPGYTGHVEDTLTGMTYMQQRYYDPYVERFLSVDPVTAYSGTGANFNRYRYANDNPYKFMDPDGRAISCTNGNCTMTADTYDSSRSSGKTILASQDVKTVTNAAVSKFTVRSGSQESLGFVVTNSKGEHETKLMRGASTTSSSAGSTAAATIPKNAQAVIHGHIDGGPNRSDGMVDMPERNGGYGDAHSLQSGIPTATVSHGQVGWHEMTKGQLQFTYPQGAMTEDQSTNMQNNLNNEQKMFLSPGPEG